MGTIIVCVVLAAVIGAAAYGTIRKIKYGSSCCGGKDPMPAKVKVKDKNKSNYPYTYLLKVDGMHCSGCVRKLENVFHSEDGLWAIVSLEKKEVILRSKKEFERKSVGKIVASAGFTLLDFEVTGPGGRG